MREGGSAYFTGLLGLFAIIYERHSLVDGDDTQCDREEASSVKLLR